MGCPESAGGGLIGRSRPVTGTDHRSRRTALQTYENDVAARARHFARKNDAILAYRAEFGRQPID
jgi:hypothetical protein